eukprot:7460770-Alexandrium_andersonii.AAC.1
MARAATPCAAARAIGAAARAIGAAPPPRAPMTLAVAGCGLARGGGLSSWDLRQPGGRAHS